MTTALTVFRFPLLNVLHHVIPFLHQNGRTLQPTAADVYLATAVATVPVEATTGTTAITVPVPFCTIPIGAR